MMISLWHNSVFAAYFFFLLVETDRAKHQTNYENPLDVEVSNREYCAVDSLGRFSSGIKNT